MCCFFSMDKALGRIPVLPSAFSVVNYFNIECCIYVSYTACASAEVRCCVIVHAVAVKEQRLFVCES
jgi:hypothetical protein